MGGGVLCAVIRLSLGTAARLGLIEARMDSPPTTAYLLHGESCSRDCSFCPQARSSWGRAGRLGRITWPAFPRTEVLASLKEAPDKGFARVCLQAVREPGGREGLCRLIDGIEDAVSLPLSTSLPVASEREAENYLEAGAERLSIALDAVSPDIYRRHKGGNFQRRLQLILDCARRWEGRISTHIICGLGETEEELIRLLARLVGAKIRVGLFAFTPLRGTRLAEHPPPEPKVYRRIQAIHYLLRRGIIGERELSFRGGSLLSPGLSKRELQELLQLSLIHI